MRLLSIGVMCISVAMLALASGSRLSSADLEKQVADTERAFAATMRARDHAAFAGFLADEAVFMSARATLRGRSSQASKAAATVGLPSTGRTAAFTPACCQRASPSFCRIVVTAAVYHPGRRADSELPPRRGGPPR